MSTKDVSQPIRPERSRIDLVLTQYVIALSVVMMLFGLRQWAVILGIMPGQTGDFETMATPWAVVTVHMAVVDVIVAVGLWNQAAWGKVLWVYAALFEVAIHTAFIGTFGTQWPVVAFHVVTLVVFGLLTLLSRRQIRR
jgi:hypothetical protein